ncbi:MAG: lipopolysaccharide biosynthesis protein [Opitutales bacterium]|nr:lipopolysaccharide biosynthesis protein [Opitutales bacterium]
MQHTSSNGKTDHTTSLFKKQLPRNALMKGMSFGTALLVGLLFVPFLVNSLGSAAFGFIALAAVLTQYASTISTCISKAVARYLTMEMHKPGGNPMEVFNSALLLFCIVMVVQTPLFVLAITFADTIFTIPAPLLEDCIILFSCSALAFVFTLPTGVFAVSSFAKNRVDVSEAISLGRVLLRPTLVVSLFYIAGPHLRYVGYVDLLIAFLLLVANIVSWRVLTPELRLHPSVAKLAKFKPILGMSLWILINYLGTLLYLRTDIWIANRFISPDAAGQFSALTQWNLLLRASGETLALLTAPMVMIYCAAGKEKQMGRIVSTAMKIMTSILAIPIAIIVVFGSEIVSIWIGPEYSGFNAILAIVVIHIIVNEGVSPLFQIQAAKNKVRLPALMTMGMGLLNVAVALVVVGYFKCGLMGLAITGAVVLTLKNAVFTPWYAAHFLGIPLGTFYKPLVSGTLLMCACMLVSCAIKWAFHPTSVVGLAIVGIVMGLLGSCGLWFAVLDDHERKHIIDLVPERLRPLVSHILRRPHGPEKHLLP